MKFLQTSGRLVVSSVIAAGCGHAPPPPVAPPPLALAPPKIQLAVIPAESDAFPRVARAVSASLAGAKVAGVDETSISKVSLEVVQLSIECVEPTPACYQAIGRSMAVNRLLFARIESAARRALKISVTLFDVDARAATRTAAKVFASEAAASAGIAALVSEVTR